MSLKINNFTGDNARPVIRKRNVTKAASLPFNILESPLSPSSKQNLPNFCATISHLDDPAITKVKSAIDATLKILASEPDDEIKIKSLSESINKAPQKESWAYRIERAKLLVKNKDIDSVELAIDDLHKANRFHSNKIILFLLVDAYIIINKWAEAYDFFEEAVNVSGGLDLALKAAPQSTSFINKNFTVIRNLLKGKESFKKCWEDLPRQHRLVILENYQTLVQSKKTSLSIQKYLLEAVKRGEELRKVLDSEKGGNWTYLIEKFFTETVKENVKRHQLFQNIIFTISEFKEANKTEFLLRMISFTQKMIKGGATDEGVDLAITFFETLAKTHREYSSTICFEINDIIDECILDEQIDIDDKVKEGMILDANFYDNHFKNFWTNIQDCLESFRAISKVDPTLSPAFLMIFKHDPLIIPNYHELLKLLGADNFVFLMNRCLRREANKPNKLLNKITPDFLRSVMACKDLQSKFKRVIEIEKATNSSIIPIYTVNSKRLNDPLFYLLDKNINLATMLDKEAINALNIYSIICQRITEDEESVLHIFDLAADYPYALEYLLKEQSLWEDTEYASKFFVTIMRRFNDPKTRNDVYGFLRLLDTKKVDLAFKLFGMMEKSPVVAKQIFKLVHSGDTDLVEILLNENVNKDDPINVKIWENLNPLTAPLIKVIVKLKRENHPLLKLLAKEPKNESFSPLFCGFAALYSQGDPKFLDTCLEMALKTKLLEPFEELALKCIAAGRYSMVKSLLSNDAEEQLFWKFIFSNSFEITKIYELYDLHCNLKAVGWLPGKGQKIQLQAIQKAKSDPQAKFEDPTLTKLEEAEKLFKAAENLPQMLVAISKCLVMPSGRINIANIERMKKLKFLANKPSDHPVKRHVEFILDSLAKDAYFSERLELLQPPKPGSTAEKVLKALIKPEGDLTSTDCRVAILTALLTPLRQSDAGSCFATAVAIETATSLNGIKQILEDLMSIVMNDALFRKNNFFAKESNKYPIFFYLKQFEAHFPNDNFLLRVWEFAVASMSSNNPGLEDLKTNLKTALKAALNAFAKNLDETSKKALMANHDPLIAMISKEVLSRVAFRYLGFLKNKKTNHLGVWAAYDKGNNVALIKSKEMLLKTFLNSFKTLKNQPNDLAEKLPLDQLFEFLPKFADSNQFLNIILGKAEEEDINNYLGSQGFQNENSLVHYRGGHEQYVLGTYHNGAQVYVRKLPKSHHIIDSFHKYVQRMQANERADVLANPNLYRTCSFVGHTFNLNLGAIFHLVAKSTSSANIISQMHDENLKFLQTNVRKMVDVVMFKTKERVQRPIYKTIVARFVVDFEPKVRERLNKEINSVLHDKKFKTVQDLIPVIQNTTSTLLPDWKLRKQLKSKLISILANSAHLENRRPNILNFADTNWDCQRHVALGIDVGTEFFFPDFTDNPESENWDFRDLKIAHYRKSTDDFTRNYALKVHSS